MKKVILFLLMLSLSAGFVPVLAQDAPAPAAEAGLGGMGLRVQLDNASSPKELSSSLRIVLMLTALSLAPSAIIMMTSFTRILIVLGFLRQALGTQQTPSAQILAGMALFLTIFVMGPVWTKINQDAIQPYLAEQITQEEAWIRGLAPVRAFMEHQVGSEEVALFTELSRAEKKKPEDAIPLQALVPAFMISELKIAFQLGFLIYLPFLVIDLVIASSLMSLGMMMLPPMMISLPIKLLFFVLADGWALMIRGVVSSFAT